MATIKSYTDINQSRKLAEILPLESADTVLLHEEPYETSDSKFDGLHQVLCVPFKNYDKSYRQKYRNISYFPCWSLVALLEVLPNYQLQTQDDGIGLLCSCNGKFNIITEDNAVDACVTMIEKLHELNLL
jgi:hypothetical protein